MKPIFQHRTEAGWRLAQALASRGYTSPDLLVLGIPRGGIVVAAEVARALGAPLDVVIARRLRAPDKPELAIGALISGGEAPLVDEELARATGATPEYLEEESRVQREELDRRLSAYRGDRPAPEIEGRTVIVIDDGIATGLTFQAVLRGLRGQGAARIVAAVPVAPPASLATLRGLADDVVCLATPEPFLSVGTWYREFAQNTDEEVVALLHEDGSMWQTTDERPPTTDEGRSTVSVVGGRSSLVDSSSVMIAVGEAKLPGVLTVPAEAKAIVVFAHGSGSGRESPRNLFVARVLQEAGFGTLLFDLLEAEEAAERGNRFDIDLLAERLLRATDWVRQQPETRDLPVAYFGASTGAAAALQAAATAPEAITAIVSRGGRPDMAAAHLAQVRAPVLLIVGGNDEAVLGMNQAALELLPGAKALEIVPGAGHVFEEPGTLEEVARLAREWFRRCLAGDQPAEKPSAKPKVRIVLTREQQLELAATTGVMLGILEIDTDDLEAGELPWAQVPGLTDPR